MQRAGRGYPAAGRSSLRADPPAAGSRGVVRISAEALQPFRLPLAGQRSGTGKRALPGDPQGGVPSSPRRSGPDCPRSSGRGSGSPLGVPAGRSPRCLPRPGGEDSPSGGGRVSTRPDPAGHRAAPGQLGGRSPGPGPGPQQSVPPGGPVGGAGKARTRGPLTPGCKIGLSVRAIGGSLPAILSRPLYPSLHRYPAVLLLL